MRGDDSTDGYNVAIRSFVAIAQSFRLHFTIFNSTQVSIRSFVVITKSFRLHFHHRQFDSGEILMRLSEI